jgi:hypothetical protein
MMNRPFFLSALCAGLLVLSGCVRNASTPGVGSGNPDLGPLSDAGAVQGGSDGSMADAASGTDVGSSPGADASMSTPDGAAPAATCDGVCDRFVECAADLCPEASALVLRASCRLACMDAPAFAALASSVDECSDLVTFVGRRSPEIGMRCDLGSEADPLCAAYAIRASECFSEVCPNSDELGEGIVSLFGSICEDQVSGGRWAPNFLDGIEMAMCDHPLIGPMIEYLTVRGEGEDSGGFEALCEDGPVTAGETCHAACDFIGDCIPAGTPNEQGGWLADYDVCRWVCGTSPDIDPEV